MVIELSNLTVEFRQRGRRPSRLRALDDVTLEVEAGQVLALIGSNGAGKSTAIHSLLGLVSPTAGHARVFGRSLEPGAPEFRDILYLPEEPYYHDFLTVEEAIRYYVGLSGRAISNDDLRNVLTRLRLDTSQATLIRDCSKGTKQKVGLAQCLLREPRLLILDEPMRGLDPGTVHDFRDALHALHQLGSTILMSSHILSEVQQLATHVAVLDDGRLLSHQRLDEMVATSTTLEDAFLSIVGAHRSAAAGGASHA